MKLEDVSALVEAFFGSKSKAGFGVSNHNSAFDGLSPNTLIALGKIQRVLDFIEVAAIEGTGLEQRGPSMK